MFMRVLAVLGKCILEIMPRYAGSRIFRADRGQQDLRNKRELRLSHYIFFDIMPRCHRSGYRSGSRGVLCRQDLCEKNSQ